MTADPLGRLRARLAGSYDLGAEIGRGGMSVVYQARDLRHDRDVAVKVLRPELAAMLGDDRFLREIRIETELQHPNILPVLDSGDGEMPYFVLPYLAGPTVRARLQTEGSLPIDDAVRIAIGVAGALGHAHAQGIVHRDVKPENILLGDNGEAVLADFGIARAITAVAGDRLTSEGIAVGTPTYMSPEQAGAGRELDGRSDLYSLGVVLFEMLTGEPPFTGRTPRAVIAKHQAEPPPSLALLRPTVPDHLVRALQRLLAKTPADRFATAEELIRVLQAGALAPVWTTRTQTARRRLVGGVAAIIVVAGAAVVIALRKPAPLDDQRVVVFPALETGSGPSRANLDVPLAIELALDHARPLRWDHGWDWLPEAIRLNPLGKEVENHAAFGTGKFVNRHTFDTVVWRSIAWGGG